MIRNLGILIGSMVLILWANSIPHAAGEWNVSGLLSLLAGWLLGMGMAYEAHLSILKEDRQARKIVNG